MQVLVFAALLGLIGGFRSFTTLAVYWIMRRGGIAAFALGLIAVMEYALDIHPKAQARTGPVGLVARFGASAFLGWTIAAGTGTSQLLAAFVAGIAAVIGAHLTLLLRMRLITAVGAVPAGLIEDAVTIALAALVISRI